MQMKDKSKRKKKIWIAAVIVLILAAGGTGLGLYENSLVYKSCSVEAGVEISAADFLTGEDANAVIIGYEDGFDTSVPGQYELKVKTGFFSHSVQLIVQDTIAPQLEVQEILVEYGEETAPEDFVMLLSDATETKLFYVTEPDFAQSGLQTVEIGAVDLGGNQTTAQTQLTICPVKRTLQAEAGENIPAVEDFLLDQSVANVSYVTDVSEMELNHVGNYAITILADGREYETQLVVVDTCAPLFSVQNLDGYTIVGRDAADFVTECTDATDVTFSFAAEPDFSKTGGQTVTIVATDEGGNTARMDAVLQLAEDTEPPIIMSTYDITVNVGDTVSYRNHIFVTDNSGEDIALEIDSSEVDLNTVGLYPVTCTATDAAGNTTTVELTVNVKVMEYTESDVYAMADEVLEQILTEDMSNYDKAYAIFRYVKTHLTYSSGGDHDDWLKEAGDAFTKGLGDCLAYAGMSKALLTRAGITNMDIHKIPAKTRHYWNLVDIGDGHGWYHFDTCPRAIDNQWFFLWTDEQMLEYSVNHDNCFNYDPSAYPDIP